MFFVCHLWLFLIYVVSLPARCVLARLLPFWLGIVLLISFIYLCELGISNRSFLLVLSLPFLILLVIVTSSIVPRITLPVRLMSYVLSCLSHSPALCGRWVSAHVVRCSLFQVQALLSRLSFHSFFFVHIFLSHENIFSLSIFSCLSFAFLHGCSVLFCCAWLCHSTTSFCLPVMLTCSFLALLRHTS